MFGKGGQQRREELSAYLYIYISYEIIWKMHTYIYCTTKTKTKRKEEEDEEKDKVPWIIPAAKIPTVEHEVGT